MDYKPRYIQPFTLTEAIALDIPVISEEIARLRNSIQRLQSTQSVLEKVLNQPGAADPEISQAFEENKTVMYDEPFFAQTQRHLSHDSASQQERITILEMALREKGVVSGGHYLAPAQNINNLSNNSGAQGSTEESTADAVLPDDNDDGVYL